VARETCQDEEAYYLGTTCHITHYQAKSEKRRTGWTKSKLTGIEKPVPRPKKPADEEGDEEEVGNDDDETIDGND
jgi:hypothetical protein